MSREIVKLSELGAFDAVGCRIRTVGDLRDVRGVVYQVDREPGVPTVVRYVEQPRVDVPSSSSPLDVVALDLSHSPTVARLERWRRQASSDLGTRLVALARHSGTASEALERIDELERKLLFAVNERKELERDAEDNLSRANEYFEVYRTKCHELQLEVRAKAVERYLAGDVPGCEELERLATAITLLLAVDA